MRGHRSAHPWEVKCSEEVGKISNLENKQNYVSIDIATDIAIMFSKKININYGVVCCLNLTKPFYFVSHIRTAQKTTSATIILEGCNHKRLPTV